jgi:hypothetical protein
MKRYGGASDGYPKPVSTPGLPFGSVTAAWLFGLVTDAQSRLPVVFRLRLATALGSERVAGVRTQETLPNKACHQAIRIEQDALVTLKLSTPAHRNRFKRNVVVSC